MKKVFMFVLVALLAFAGYAGATAVTDSLTASDAVQINRSSPIATRTDLGTRLRGPLMTGATTSSACTTSVGACNTVSTTETTAATLKTTGNSWGESISLANGQPGQLKTYILVTDGGKDFYVTPVTKTGFTSVQLNDAKDTVTLRYVDDTTGWVIGGNNGTTVN